MLPVKHNLMSVKGEYITLVIGYSNLLDASDLFACVRKYMYEPIVRVDGEKVNITYFTTLPFQINDGEIQYMENQNVERTLPSTAEPITIKFYNARMKLMFTKTVEVE